MCGLAGFLDSSLGAEAGDALLRRMLARLVHRGPDDEGRWIEGGVALGHRRLSILDLSALGHQPMASPSARYVIAFNGEIYNHDELRNTLVAQGAVFRGHSDTEVLLALIERHGLAAALEGCVGMFAIALWDRRERRLQLARDRFGEKPLYYGWHGGRLLWASELRAMREHPAFDARIDPRAVADLLRQGYIAAPRSIYAGCHRLPPSTILTLDAARPSPGSETLHTYWSPAQVLERGRQAPFTGTRAEAGERVEAWLMQAVRQQMQADVPLGAFLSGGVDSSLVTALMQRQSTRAVRTFCIGFDAAHYDEAPFARAVAAHLGTRHTEYRLGAAETLRGITEAVQLLDEPMGDSSIVPTLLVARLARAEVTVALSGDGGDELFAGYPRYALARRLRSRGLRLGRWPALLAGERLAALGQTALGRLGHREYRANLQRKAELLAARGIHGLVRRLRYQYTPPARLHPLLDSTDEDAAPVPGADAVRAAMLDDQMRYLPDDILRKTDAATMAVSLEARAPMLDHRLAEFAARLPLDFLLDEAGRGKRVLREVLSRHVPTPLVDRPKAGFTLPLVAWFRDELRSELELRVLDESMTREFAIDRAALRRAIDEHGRGVNDWSQLLWSVWSLSAWRESARRRDDEPAAPLQPPANVHAVHA